MSRRYSKTLMALIADDRSTDLQLRNVSHRDVKMANRNQYLKVDVKAKRADVIYTTTDEEETIDLEELMKDRCIALSKDPPPTSLSLALPPNHPPTQPISWSVVVQPSLE